MIRIYADQINRKDTHYVEEQLSSYEIIQMGVDEFKRWISDYINNYGDIHTCYPTFINHIGRFVREFGKNWYDDEFVVVTDNEDEHQFNPNGQLEYWPYGYFG